MSVQNQNFREKLSQALSNLSSILLILILVRCICLLIADGLGITALANATAGIREGITGFFLPPEGAAGPKAWLMSLLYAFWAMPFYPPLRAFLGIPAILVWIGLQILIRWLNGKFHPRDAFNTMRDTMESMESHRHGKDTPLEKLRRSQILVRVISTPSAPLIIDEICDLRRIAEWNISKTLQKEGLQVQFGNSDFRLCLQNEEPVIYVGSEKIQTLTVDAPIMLRAADTQQPIVYVMLLENLSQRNK